MTFSSGEVRCPRSCAGGLGLPCCSRAPCARHSRRSSVGRKDSKVLGSPHLGDTPCQANSCLRTCEANVARAKSPALEMSREDSATNSFLITTAAQSSFSRLWLLLRKDWQEGMGWCGAAYPACATRPEGHLPKKHLEKPRWAHAVLLFPSPPPPRFFHVKNQRTSS